ncbi:MAG: Tat pathway signal protein [Ignavibacteriae bacterium]|nr:Tat pathway signal protein [Ignavibacteriota bacterium]
MNKQIFRYTLVLLVSLFSTQCSRTQQRVTSYIDGPKWDPFLDTLQQRTLRYFLDVTDSVTGLSPDRWPASYSPSSVAACGFALTTFPISVERGLITREQAANRVLSSLQYILNLDQSEQPDASGYKGLFYHFLKMNNGKREWNCELSTIDTALLMAGVLCCQSYFDRDSETEQQLRTLADSLYRRVDWEWAMNGREGITLGWTPEKGFHHQIWNGYDEAMILYILALGSPTFSIPESTWDVWTKPYLRATYYGYDFVSFAPLFGHQFSHCWIDFNGIQDVYMKKFGIDYFENSRRATYSQRAYAIDNPGKWRDYSDSIWGVTACDGPKDTSFEVDGMKRRFEGYAARGGSVDWTNDDGTIAPTAAGGSVAFAPEICIPALKSIKAKYGERIFQKYGFLDAFNPTYVTPATQNGWFDVDYLGIDQGPIAIMIENLRNGFVWKLMRKNPYIVRGLKRAKFSGGWLEETK